MKEIIKYYRSFYDWSDIEVRLIVSTGRTGTNFLANYFSENFKEVYSVHEPAPDLFDLSVAKFRENKSIYNIQKQFKINRYSQYKKVKKNNNRMYLESNPNLAFLLPEAIELFKKPKIIFVTRDIRSYIISAFNKSPDNSGDIFFYGKNDHRDRITPYDIGDIYYSKKWNNWGRLQKIAWYWTKCNEEIIKNLSYTDHLMIKFEDLFISDKRIEKFKGLISYIDFHPYLKSSLIDKNLTNKMNTNSTKIITSYSDIPKKIQQEIKDISQDTREKLGY